MTEERTDEAPQASSRLLNATAIMASGTLVSRVLGFVRATLLVIVLGATTPHADAYSMATVVPNTLYMLFAGGALNTVLVPQIVRHAKNDEDGGAAFIDRVMTAFIAVLLGVTVLATAFTPQVMYLWADDMWRDPALAGHWRQLLFLAFLTMPQLFFYGAFFLIGQVLNARDRFGPMMWAPILNNVVGIGVLGLYLTVWGTNVSQSVPFTDAQVLVLGLGSTLGIVVQTLALIPAMRSINLRYRPRWDLKGQGLGQTFHLAKWMLGYVLLTTIVQVVVTRLGSAATVAEQELPGAGIAVYNTAYLVWILPHSLLTVSLATAMLPSASRHAAAHDMEGVAAETTRTLRLATTFLLPAAAAFLAVGLPFARLAFGHGANTEGWVFIGWTLVAFAVGLVPYTVQYVYLRGFYALEDTRIPFFIQIAISVVNVGLAIGLIAAVADPTTVAPRLALAYSLAYAVGAWLTHAALKRRLPALSGRTLLRHLGQLALAVLPGALVAGLASWWTHDASLPIVLAAFVTSLVVAGISFFFLAKRVGIRETTQLLDALRRRGAAGEPAGQAVPAGEASGTPPGTEGALLEYPDPDAAPEPPVRTSPLTDVPPGDVLSGRYRLDQALNRRGLTVTWRGWDLKLSRPVLIHVMDPTESRALEILDQARQAAPAVDTRFLRVWDAVLDEEGAHGSYIVCEYAPGQSLELALRKGAFTDVEAAWVVREVAAGLVGMHAQGLHHRQLNPDTVVITASGNVKIVGFLVEHALYPYRTDEAPEQADVRALGELLYASLTGRWPGAARYGLPAAPTDDQGRPVPPRSLSTRVPVELSDVVDRILSPAPRGRATRLETALDVATALSALLGGADASHALEQRLRYPIELVRITEPKPLRADRTPAAVDSIDSAESADEVTGPLRGRPDATPAAPWGRGPSEPVGDDRTEPFWVDVDDIDDVEDDDRADSRPFTPIPPPRSGVEVSQQAPSKDPQRRWQVALLALFVLVLVAGLVGVFVNQFSRSRALPTEPGAPYAVVAARDFDPSADGGDDSENPGLAGLAIDGDPATRWTTERYGRSANFNDRKPGAGVLVDLGEPRSVRWVLVDVGSGPTSGEIRVPVDEEAGAPPMDSRDAWRRVASFEPSTGRVQVRLDDPVTTRFVLVYLTNLPFEDPNYVGSIHEISVSG